MSNISSPICAVQIKAAGPDSLTVTSSGDNANTALFTVLITYSHIPERLQNTQHLFILEKQIALFERSERQKKREK